MRHFLRIAEGLDVLPTLNALAVNADLWNENDLRTSFPGSPHADTDDVWLLFNRIPDDPADAVNDLAVVPYRAWQILAPLRYMVLDLMRRVEGTQLGRVMITRLAPGASITEHTDQGAPATFFTRYQIALQSLPGALFASGGEVVNFKSGEVWFVDNTVPHSVVNNSADDRIVCIVDIRGPVGC